MSVEIRFAIENDFFREPLKVWVEWKCPFLPRIGEYINPWIWIEEEITKEDITNNLTEEGESDLRKWDGKFSHWLYEISFVKCNTIKSIGYYLQGNEENDGIFVTMQIGSEEKRRR